VGANITITSGEILAVLGGAFSLVTFIWYAAMYVGKLTVRVDDHTRELKSHESRLDDHDGELRFLKDIRK